MEVLDLMNTHDNWEEMLTQPPYSIMVRRDEDYILLRYNQLSSDFSLPIVRECRGSIFYRNEDGKYECVCRAFDKFGNYGESYTPEIDWNSAVVEEKADGSLLKLFHHNGNWHVATNGTIDAYKAEISDTGLTFGELFDEAIRNMTVQDFFKHLDKNMTYMFELVSPKSRVTISYPETRLYYLGCRDITTMRECKPYYPVMHEAGIIYPKIYPLNTLEGCLAYVKSMTKDEEGFVVKDRYFNRIKIKSPEYLNAFHMNNNGVITTKRIVGMIKANTIDDFMAYCPEYKEQVREVFDRIFNVAKTLEDVWQLCKGAEGANREVFSCVIRKLPYRDFLWKKYDNPTLTGLDYVMNQREKKIKEMIEEIEE